MKNCFVFVFALIATIAANVCSAAIALSRAEAAIHNEFCSNGGECAEIIVNTLTANDFGPLKLKIQGFSEDELKFISVTLKMFCETPGVNRTKCLNFKGSNFVKPTMAGSFCTSLISEEGPISVLSVDLSYGYAAIAGCIAYDLIDKDSEDAGRNTCMDTVSDISRAAGDIIRFRKYLISLLPNRDHDTKVLNRKFRAVRARLQAKSESVLAECGRRKVSPKPNLTV